VHNCKKQRCADDANKELHRCLLAEGRLFLDGATRYRFQILRSSGKYTSGWESAGLGT
jgi:hypothetical protein